MKSSSSFESTSLKLENSS
ncbi:unnamed protein product, partial [Brachionus calyciflorus]